MDGLSTASHCLAHDIRILMLILIHTHHSHPLPLDTTHTDDAARRILQNEIKEVSKWDRNSFLKSSTDIIAIEKTLADKMKARFGVQ
ncbi:hypothetical protein EON65_33180 [archaeon]|nr:MAG: hypothetical protein EON65_33180 [archaeon]